ncbi:MAG: glycosyltransferase family 4 protein [Chlamydiales bacterium]|nr:glycosyltransferase family 4 protein [Chlamydiales bacterium]
MHVFYPYNEILPKKTAHDVYIFQECAAFAESGIKTTLLIGKGSKSKNELLLHYLPKALENKDLLEIDSLPIVRKNNCLNLSWNYPFFYFTQRAILKKLPQVVFLSVFKQGRYHLKRKVAGVFYVYEVHELSYYPGRTFSKRAAQELEMLACADLVSVTTEQLKNILIAPPYSLQVPIEVIPLAVHSKKLPDNNVESSFLRLCYVGQLYEAQGILHLLHALVELPLATLKVVGGKEEEVAYYKSLADTLGISERVYFAGFHPPTKISELISDTDIFVAPFTASGKMPFVAHTKLMEYREWKRAMLVPDLPVVREHFNEADGVVFYEPGSTKSLVSSVSPYMQKSHLKQLQMMAMQRQEIFSWKKRAERYKQIIIDKK